jgi:hypothetical protein
LTVSNDRAEILGVAAALMIPAVVAGWKAASLRGDINEKWSERVAVAHAGLTTLAVEELLALQIEIGRLLGGSGGGFDPGQVTIDPEPLTSRSERFGALIRARDSVQARFVRHRRLGPYLLGACVLYILGLGASTAVFEDVVDSEVVKVVGLGAVTLAIGIAVVVFILFAYYESRLASAEILSQGSTRAVAPEFDE